MSIRSWWLKNPVRRKLLQGKQAAYLKEVGAAKEGRVVIFLVPGRDRVNGGIISIVSLAEESAKLRDHHGAAVQLCTLPEDPPLLKFTKFANQSFIVGLDVLLRSLRPGTEVLVHVPELYVERVGGALPRLIADFPGISWQFNILLQNIDGIPEKGAVQALVAVGKTTCTTAHKRYCNDETAQRIGCPVRHFSTFCSPEKYLHKSYPEKENLVVVSPDKHPQREEVLTAVRSRLPHYRFQVIRNLTYEEYKRVIAQAKFSITFGEGLDGYLVEPVFSGGIGSAVYNDRFFTDDMKSLPFVYPSLEALSERFPADVGAVDEAVRYQETHRLQFETFAFHYSHEQYVGNLARFYREEFAAQRSA